MEGLEQQRAEPSDEHRCIGVHPPNRSVVVEPTGFGGGEQLVASTLGIRSDHAHSDLLADPGPDLVGEIHRVATIVPAGVAVMSSFAVGPCERWARDLVVMIVIVPRVRRTGIAER
jgi:hypothetical protein